MKFKSVRLQYSPQCSGRQCESREMSHADLVKSLAINQSFLRAAVSASGSRGEECFARNRQSLQDLGLWSNS